MRLRFYFWFPYSCWSPLFSQQDYASLAPLKKNNYFLFLTKGKTRLISHYSVITNSRDLPMLNLTNRGNHVTMSLLGTSVFALCGLPKPIYFPKKSYENQTLPHLIYFNDETLGNEANYETDRHCYSRLTPRRLKACLQTSNRLLLNNKYLLINLFIN